MAEGSLEGGEFGAEFGAAGGVVEGSGEGELVPLRGEGADGLVEDDDGDAGELGAALVVFQRLARQFEEAEDAGERGLFVSVFGREILRGDAGEQFDVEFPCGPAVGVLRRPFRLENARMNPEGGHPPFFQPVPPFHGAVFKQSKSNGQAASRMPLMVPVAPVCLSASHGAS